MSHEVKLNCFALKLKKARGKSTEFLPLKNIKKEDKEEIVDFIDFFKRYVISFEGAFYKNEKTGKALSLSSQKLKIFSEKRIITGVVEGGDTEIGGKIKKVDDATDENFIKITKDDVHAIEYFFLIWLPTETNIGLLIVQAISDKSVTEEFKMHFSKYVSLNTDNSLAVERVIPNEMIQKIQDDGIIDRISIVSNQVPIETAERLLNGLVFTEGGDIKIEIKISRLGKWTQTIKEAVEAFKKENKTIFHTVELHRELGIDENSDISIEFEKNGKKASAKMSKKFEFTPYVYIDEEHIERDPDTNLPYMHSIERYVHDVYFPLMKDIILDNS